MNVSQLHPEEALDLYEAGRLGPRELEALKAHLARCPSCAAHVQWRSDVQATLTESSGGAAEARRMAATALARRGIPAPVHAEGGTRGRPAHHVGRDRRDLPGLGRRLGEVLALRRTDVATPERARSTGVTGAAAAAPAHRLAGPAFPLGEPAARVPCPAGGRRGTTAVVPACASGGSAAVPRPSPDRHFRGA